jgi:hypothetical protein
MGAVGRPWRKRGAARADKKGQGLRRTAIALLRLLAFVAGIVVVAGTLASAIRSFVVPRGVPNRLAGAVFIAVRQLFALWTRRLDSYEERDRAMVLYAPFSLLALPVVWLTLVLVGYTLTYWALDLSSWQAAFEASGSSLFTLGFARIDGLPSILIFSEAAIGLTLAALLIAYLPTMYAAFARRETAVTLLEVRAGSPPSAVKMIARLHRVGQLERLGDIWRTWEVWFADIEESHTSLAALAFYRSPQPDRSWVTAAGAVLDCAALVSSALDRPRDPEAELCLRAGYLALSRIADLFNVDYDPDPHFPDVPISVTRAEFDRACDTLSRVGVAMKADREKAWRDFAGWRVNYDVPLLALADLTMAPYAPWSSDRAYRRRPPFNIFAHKKSPMRQAREAQRRQPLSVPDPEEAQLMPGASDAWRVTRGE